MSLNSVKTMIHDGYGSAECQKLDLKLTASPKNSTTIALVSSFGQKSVCDLPGFYIFHLSLVTAVIYWDAYQHDYSYPATIGPDAMFMDDDARRGFTLSTNT
ncbi:hypothetical protein TNCV_1966611 [Trichonephila clavipes]|nr:hypothetical protein TNCV_1966611 [Trichonephila clavipes]